LRNRRHLLAWILGTAALAALLTPSPAWADFSLRDWRYYKTIILPGSLGRDALVELAPDQQLFTGAAPDLVDLRIIASNDVEVPYKLEVSRGERQRTALSVSLRDMGYVPGRYTTFNADLGQAGLLHNQIEFQTLTRSFFRTATVESSADGATWAKVAEQPVYDFTDRESGFTTRYTGIRYGETTARHLRVRISDDGEGPFDITGASVFYLKETAAREVSWPASLAPTGRDTERRATLLELDLGAPGLPTHRVAVAVPDVNFYREVTLEASANRREWRMIQARASIYAYDTPKFVGKSLGFTYPESTERYLRLVIHDEDNLPLQVQGVEVWGFQRRLVFAGNLGESYRLYYGSAEARRPSYDIERVFPYLTTDALPRAGLDPQALNPSFMEKKPPVSERLPWLLPTAVAVAAIFVALLLLAVVRNAKKLLPPPPP